MDADSSLPERGRLYVIGDIHGRSDLLDRIVAAISDDLAGHRRGIAHLSLNTAKFRSPRDEKFVSRPGVF